MCDYALLNWPVFTRGPTPKIFTANEYESRRRVNPSWPRVAKTRGGVKPYRWREENKARLWSNVKWCRALNVGTLVSVRAWLEGVVCKAVLSGEDPAMSAGWEQAHLPPVSCCLTSQGLAQSSRGLRLLSTLPVSDQLADSDCKHGGLTISVFTVVIFSSRAEKPCGAAVAEVVCLSEYCWRIWEWKIRTRPRLPSRCITHSRQIICPLRFLRIYFPFTHTHTQCFIHVTAVTCQPEFTSFTRICAQWRWRCCLKGFHCSHPRKYAPVSCKCPDLHQLGAINWCTP